MRVAIRPTHLGSGGVARRIEAEKRYCGRFGWALVDREDEADLVVGHATARCQQLDVMVCHGLMPVEGSAQSDPAWRINRMVLENIRKSRRVIAVSRYTAELLEREVGLGPDLRVIYNGVDLEEFSQVEGLGLGERLGRPLVLWGKISLAGWLEDAARLAEALPEVSFIFTVWPNGRKKPSNVHIIGPQPYERMKRILADCDILLALTKENFSVQVLEALALGKPILAYNWGGTPEAVRHKIEGFLAEPGDLDGLVEGLRYCLDNYTQLSQAAKKRATEFTWTRQIELECEVWNEALEERRAEAKAPKVVVVVPNYNYHHYLPEALDSIRRQTFPDWECVVVDDGSEVDPEQYIADFLTDKRFRLVRQENRGVSAARNKGIAESAAPFCLCLDADDLLEPRALEVLVKAFETDKGHRLGFVYGQMSYLVDGEKRPSPGWPRPFSVDELCRHNIVPTAAMFRRKAWRRAGGYPPEPEVEGWAWEDYDFWLSLVERGWLGRFVRVPFFIYRRHKGSRIEGAISRAARFQSIIRRRHGRLYKKTWPLCLADQRRAREGGELCLVEYRGRKMGHISVHLGGKVYRFSRRHRVKLLPCRLAARLKSSPDFRVRQRKCPKISIVIPCYNQAEYLADAIDSALAQTWDNIEVVVVDDGSTDEIKEVLSQYADEKVVKVVRQEHKGLAAARNAGIAAASGEYILPLDADDVLHPEAVERLFRALEERDGKGVAYSDFWIFGEGVRPGTFQLPDYDFRQLLRKNLMAATALFPKRAWAEAGGYKEEMSRLGGWEDYEFWINLGKLGYCGVHVPEPLFGYRQHRGSMRQEAQRRKKLLQSAIMRFHADVYGGRFPMGCCGSSVRSMRKSSPGELSLSSSPGKLVKVRYTGMKRGSFTVRGKSSGRLYRFSAFHPEKYVEEKDWQAGSFRGPFILVKDEPQPGQPDDLTKIKGIGSKMAERLKEVGIDSYRGLLAARPEDIAERLGLPGVTTDRVRKWQEEARGLASVSGR